MTAPLVRDPMVTLYARNFAATLAFYERLGFIRTFQHPDSGRPIHVELRVGQFQLGIVDIDLAAPDHGLDVRLAGDSAELVFWTDDTDALFARLVSEGATVMSTPADFLDHRTAWVRDPDGHPVHICSR